MDRSGDGGDLRDDAERYERALAEREPPVDELERERARPVPPAGSKPRTDRPRRGNVGA